MVCSALAASGLRSNARRTTSSSRNCLSVLLTEGGAVKALCALTAMHRHASSGAPIQRIFTGISLVSLNKKATQGTRVPGPDVRQREGTRFGRCKGGKEPAAGAYRREDIRQSSQVQDEDRSAEGRPSVSHAQSDFPHVHLQAKLATTFLLALRCSRESG